MIESYEIIKLASTQKDHTGSSPIWAVDGQLQVKNYYLTASTPVNITDFVVPSADLEFALREMKDANVKVSKGFIQLNSGGAVTKIKQLSEDPPKLEKPDIELTPPPNLEQLMDAFEAIEPFAVGDDVKVWSRFVKITENSLVATDNVVLAIADVEEGTGIERASFPHDVIKYLISRRKDVKAWGSDGATLVIEFNDGSWIQTGCVRPEMPDIAVKVISEFDYDWQNIAEITKDYRDELSAAAKFSDRYVSIYPDKIVATRGSIEHKRDVTSELGNVKGPVDFADKYVRLIIQYATHIDLSFESDQFKDGDDDDKFPIPFKVANGRGIILPRK